MGDGKARMASLKIIDRRALKWIASITMLLDHVAYGLIYQVFMFRLFPQVQWLPGLYNVMRRLGRLAFPLYIFMMVDGFYYTRDRRKYLGRLALFSLISEIPFDIGINMTLLSKPPFFLEFDSQNVFFTQTIGFMAIWLMDTFLAGGRDYGRGHRREWIKLLFRPSSLLVIALVGTAGGWAAWVLKTDYSYYGVLAIMAAYLVRPLGAGWLETAATALVLTLGQASWMIPRTGFAGYLAKGSLFEVFSFLAVLVIIFYNGKKGRSSTAGKWGFYCFYPAHLLLIGLLACYFMKM